MLKEKESNFWDTTDFIRLVPEKDCAVKGGVLYIELKSNKFEFAIFILE